MIEKSPINGKSPKIHPSAFIAKNAVIIGDVTIGANTNVWFGVIIRGDVCKIVIGENCSIQENTVIHSEPGTKATIGNNIIVGHQAMIHGPCKIGDFSMVGLSSTVLQGAKMGRGVVLAGGSLLRGEAKEFHLYAGIPAKEKKNYGESRIETGTNAALSYVETGRKFKEGGFQHDIVEEFLMKKTG